MIRIKALNDGSDSSDDSGSECKQVTREAEEESLNKLYTSALKDASEEKYERAIEKLHILKKELENETPKVKDAVLRNRLKYLTYKHLGIFSNDLDLLLDALELDGSDQNLWITTGRKFKEKMSFLISKRCFESAYSSNQSNYIVIENLMEIYFILNDLYSCVSMCLRALQLDANYFKAIVLINECIRLMPRIANDLKDHTGFVYTEFGGEYEPAEEVANLFLDGHKEIISQLNQIKTKRLHDDEDEASKAKKRRKLNLDIDRLRCRTAGDIGQKILALHEILISESLSICAPIVLNICNRDVKSTETENSNASALADKSAPTNGSSKPPTDSNNNSNSSQQTSTKSLLEFVDKRRSTRVKGGKAPNKTRELEDEQSILGNLLELLPDKLKTDDHSSQTDSLDRENNSSNSGSVPFLETPSAKATTSNDSKFVDKCLDSFERLFGRETRPVDIYELIDCFLTQLSTTKHITVPQVFTQLYHIYRDAHSLPVPILCEIGKDISLSNVWTCLTANELKYDKLEVVFLTCILDKLCVALSPEEYRGFVVRLLVLRGTKEFNNDWLEYTLELVTPKDNEKEKENVNDNVETMEVDDGPVAAEKPTNVNAQSLAVVASNNLIINEQYINTILKMQTMPKSSEASSEKNYTEIIQLFFTKSEAELTADEKADLSEAIVSAKMWQKGVELFENWSELNETTILNTIYECVKGGNRAKLSPKISKKVAKMASAGSDCKNGALPWIILYWALVAEGIDYRAAGNPLIKLCTMGHIHLGRKGLCTANDGEFLLISLKVFMEHDLDDEVATAFSCLFNFPSRKSQGCTHTSPHIDLQWSHCEQIYVYSEPESMPEFDSNARQSGITVEMKDFFLRIMRLVPEELQPLKRSIRITNYINGIGGNLEEDEDDDIVETPPRILTTIYYLLADFHFKTRDFAKARQFYIFDLVYNTRRFDAWAGLALSTNYQLDQLLIEGARPNEKKYQKTAFAVVQCFEQAMKLDGSNSKLWIEFGLSAYSIASNMSRMVKAADTFKWQLDTSAVMFKHEVILEKAKHCFEMVRNSEKDAEELWLAYYMLGKVSEKKKDNLIKTLEYYQLADLCLYIDGALYPKKIQYYNPPYLAVEALEVHYRIHASTMKWLLHNRKFSARMLRQVKWFILSASKTPFVERKPFSSSNSSASTSTAASKRASVSVGASIIAKSSKASAVEELLPSGEVVDPAISELIGDLLSLMGERETKFDVNKSRNELIGLCCLGLKRCLMRYPGHYKSYYRLADKYFVFGEHNIVNGMLLGGPANRSTWQLHFDTELGGSKGSNVIPGLFCDRKPANFFNGIWRIPVDEIERSGNFNQHMYRATAMLIHSAIAVEDYQQLVQLSIFLHKKPDLDKRYINDSERKELSRLAFDQCFVIARELLGRGSHGMVAEIENLAKTFIKSGVFTKETIDNCHSINEQLGGRRKY